jgi:chromosome segregation ATPase
MTFGKERQYNIIRNFTAKIEKINGKVDTLEEQLSNNGKAINEIQQKGNEVRVEIKKSIEIYDMLRANLIVIKKQIKDLEKRKTDLITQLNTIKVKMNEFVAKLLKRDIPISSQFSKLNRRNIRYGIIMKKMRKYEREIKELVPEDYEELREEITSRFETVLTELQTTKRNLYTKGKRMEKINDNLNSIRNILTKYAKVNKDMPKVINDVRKEEKVRKDAFFKEITN